jgi:Na+/alanine symporter
MIEIINDYLWGILWILIFFVALIGYYRFKQLKHQGNLDANEAKNNNQLFFISMAGSIGLGNIFVVIDAINQYGSSVILWMWIGVFFGRFVKFWEVFLSLLSKNNQDKFTGPIIYIKAINPFLATIFTIFSLAYYIEIFQFKSLVEFNSSLISTIVPQITYDYILYGVAILTCFFVFISREGKSFINVSEKLMKVFLWGYLGFAVVLSVKYGSMFLQIIKEFFFECFVWTSWKGKILPLMVGVRTAIYCNDIGVGYEGIMQQYSQIKKENYVNHAYGLVKSNTIDIIVCTCSGIMCLLYYKIKNLPHGSVASQQLIMDLFKFLIPTGGHLILNILIFCAAFTTLCTLCHSGYLIMKYLKPSWPNYVFYGLAFPVLFITLSYPINTLFNTITFCGGSLVLINCISILYFLWTKKYQQWMVNVN